MKAFLVVILAVLFSCSHNDPTVASQFNEDERIVNEITRKVGAKLKKETGLRPCGTGGNMMHGVKMLALSFDANFDLSVEEGRKLLIKSVDEFVQAVNADARIHPYLVDNPFGPKNVEIRIFLYHPNGSNVTPGALSVIKAINGMLIYETQDVESHLNILFEEHYAEALSKIKDHSDR